MFQRRGSFALLIAFVASTAAPAQDATLKWELKKDTPFFQTMTTSTQQTITVQGTQVQQNQEQTFYMSFTPTDVKDDVATIKQKIIGLKMSIDIGGSKIAYDSNDPNAAGGGTSSTLNKFFEALKTADFTLTLDRKTMKVTKIEGQEKFREELAKANPTMKPLLDKILSDKALQDMSDPVFAALPGDKKKKGDNWTRDTSLDMGPIGKYDTKYTYTYDGPDKDKNEKVTIKNELKYTAPDEKAAGGLPFKIKTAALEGKDSSGSAIYDPKTGMLKSMEMNLTLTGNLTIEIGSQSSSVTLDQKQKTTFAFADKDPTPKKP